MNIHEQNLPDSGNQEFPGFTEKNDYYQAGEIADTPVYFDPITESNGTAFANNGIDRLPEDALPVGELIEQPMVAMAAAAPTTTPIPKDYVPSPCAYGLTGQDSVSLNNGALGYSATDFSLPGKNGFNLTISRRYDSGGDSQKKY